MRYDGDSDEPEEHIRDRREFYSALGISCMVAATKHSALSCRYETLKLYPSMWYSLTTHAHSLQGKDPECTSL